MKYHDFELRAWCVDKSHAEVLVHSSPAGDMRQPQLIDFDAKHSEVLEQIFRHTDQQLWFSADRDVMQHVINLGRDLAQVLLPAVVATLLEKSLAQIPPGDGLRLRLCLDSTLVDLPWEFLYLDCDVAFRGFLSLIPRISLVRESPRLIEPLPEQDLAERLLFAGTYWPTAEGGWKDGFGVETEYDKLVAALGRLTDWIRPAYVRCHEGFEEAFAEPTAIFHYSGHTDVEDGRGYLLRRFPDDGWEGRLSSDELATRLDRAGTRLAFFSACNSGRWSFVEPLLRGGLRAVVGCHGIVSNIGTFAFTEKLYRMLASGMSLDEAVTWSRLSLLDATEPDHGGLKGQKSFEWGAFMVYMPSAHDVLLPRTPRVEVKDTQRDLRERRQATIDKVRPNLEKDFRTSTDGIQVRAFDRLTLVRNLSRLAPGDWATFVAAIEGAATHISRQGIVAEQVAELIRWVESPTGPGLAAIEDAFNALQDP
ncbi:MAG TPA: CHAT domain-containing protein [Isosphaeraceae bacterium]|nr:CHAT domain-containing protein [Isosphaeraceae bacterium]